MRSEPPNGAPDSSSPTRSRVGNWVIDPALDEISSQGKVVKLEPRTMRLLVYLVEHRERVVGVQELHRHVAIGIQHHRPIETGIGRHG